MRRLSPFSFLNSAALLFHHTELSSNLDHPGEKNERIPNPTPAFLRDSQRMVKPWVEDLMQIYACTAFFVYSTTFLVFFYELSSLLIRFSLFNILGFLSYQLMFAFLESILVAACTTVLVHLVPLRQVRSHRVAVGALFLLAFATSSLIFRDKIQIAQYLYGTSGFTEEHVSQIIMFLWLFAAVGLSFLATQLIKAERFATWMESKLQNFAVLASVYTTLSMIGVLIVVYRNLQ